MPHTICGIFVATPLLTEVAEIYDLRPLLRFEQFVFRPVDHYYSTYWAHRLGIDGRFPSSEDMPSVFPRDRVLLQLIRNATGIETPDFTIVMTEYFAGVGGQWALLFRNGEPRACCDINSALAGLGVRRRNGSDEFETVGFDACRSNPDYLDRYADLCELHGL